MTRYGYIQLMGDEYKKFYSVYKQVGSNTMRHPCIFIAFLIINLSHGQVLKLKKYKTIINNKSFVSKIEKFDPHGNLVSSITYPEGNNKKEIYKENHIYNFQKLALRFPFFWEREFRKTEIDHACTMTLRQPVLDLHLLRKPLAMHQIILLQYPFASTN